MNILNRENIKRLLQKDMLSYFKSENYYRRDNKKIFLKYYEII